MKCHRCNGEMRIDDYENGDLYSDDGKMPCPTCYGDGEVEYEIVERSSGYWIVDNDGVVYDEPFIELKDAVNKLEEIILDLYNSSDVN